MKRIQDEDLLSVYKIQSGNTLHMVKGVAKSTNTSSSSASPASRVPTMQAGQNPSDPLTLLNSHRAHGAMAGLNPFAQLGVNPNDPNLVLISPTTYAEADIYVLMFRWAA